ncbi:hypothetical protein ACIRD2_18530 [Streptomyces sp. NPDC093595]
MAHPIVDLPAEHRIRSAKPLVRAALGAASRRPPPHGLAAPLAPTAKGW